MGAETGPKIVEYARSKRRTKVGSGECFDLAVEALKNASSKTAYDFGEVTATADYVWGSEVALSSVQAGDVIQYRDYTYKKAHDVETEFTFSDGTTITVTETKEWSVGRPHHTAIATGSPANGALRVIEQNVERAPGRGLEKLVDDGEIFITSISAKTTTKTETVRIDVAWGTKIKRLVGPRSAAAIDGIVRKNLGKTASAEISTTEAITVSGTLKAYRAQPK